MTVHPVDLPEVKAALVAVIGVSLLIAIGAEHSQANQWEIQTLAGRSTPADHRTIFLDRNETRMWGADPTNLVFRLPTGLTTSVDGTVYVSDSATNSIFQISPAGKWETVVPPQESKGGLYPGGFSDRPAHEAKFNLPAGLAMGPNQSLLVADTSNNRVRTIASHKGNTANYRSKVRTLIGTGVEGFSGDGGPPSKATLNNPMGVFYSRTTDKTYLADTDNDRIREIDPKDNKIRTIVGNGENGWNGDGKEGNQTSLNAPVAVLELPHGDIVFSDSLNDRVRRLSCLDKRCTKKAVSTIAGTGEPGASEQLSGKGTELRLNSPGALALHPNGKELFIADTLNHAIRRLNLSTGLMDTVVGVPGEPGHDGDEPIEDARLAHLNNPMGIAIAMGGFLLIADSSNRRIRIVDADLVPPPVTNDDLNSLIATMTTAKKPQGKLNSSRATKQGKKKKVGAAESKPLPPATNSTTALAVGNAAAAVKATPTDAVLQIRLSTGEQPQPLRALDFDNVDRVFDFGSAPHQKGVENSETPALSPRGASSSNTPSNRGAWQEVTRGRSRPGTLKPRSYDDSAEDTQSSEPLSELSAQRIDERLEEPTREQAYALLRDHFTREDYDTCPGCWRARWKEHIGPRHGSKTEALRWTRDNGDARSYFTISRLQAHDLTVKAAKAAVAGNPTATIHWETRTFDDGATDLALVLEFNPKRSTIGRDPSKRDIMCDRLRVVFALTTEESHGGREIQRLRLVTAYPTAPKQAGIALTLLTQPITW